MTDDLAVGIDLGGTKILAGVVDAGGRVLGRKQVPTQADRKAEAILDSMVGAAKDALAQAGASFADVKGVGIGSPAPLDMFRGILISPNNLLTLHGFHIVERVGAAVGRPVVLNNDANCFGLAEANYGAGVGAEVCCGFTLGTGLGSFLVIKGELFNGPHGAATEIWCSPYLGDQIEEKASGRGVARNYRKLTERVATAKEVAVLALEGDADAREAWREFGRDLGAPIAWVCNVADPDVVVLGGSMVKAWDLFQQTMFAEAMKYINAVTRRFVRIVPARLGDDAGMLGAAALILGPVRRP